MERLPLHFFLIRKQNQLLKKLPVGANGNILDPFAGLNDKDAFDYSDPLAELYDSKLTNLQLSGQQEIIEKIFNARFEMVGYRRYKV